LPTLRPSRSAPTLLGKVSGGKIVPAGTLRSPPKRRSLAFFGVGGVHKPRLSHAINNPIAPFYRALTLAERMVVIRRFRERCEIGSFGNGEFVHRFIEINE